ncbi:hypothetical protein CRYUN_Cryun16bG0009700 [Craigia yunnanensis]
MARLFSSFSNPVGSVMGQGDSNFILQDLVGESVTKIDSLVSPVIKHVSSEAIPAAQKSPGVAGGMATGVLSSASGFIGQVASEAISATQAVATEVQPAGVMSTASGFIKQVSSDAISAAQGVATEVQPAGLVSTASGFIKQVSSDAISAAQGVATEVQPVGLVSNASGFIKQVSSDAISAAQGVATEIQHAGMVGESLTKIDNLVSPVIKQVSSEAISAAQKAPGVAGGLATGVLSSATGFIGQVSSEAISAAQKAAEVATEVQPAGVLGTASGFIKQVSSEAISAAQGVATKNQHAGVVKEEQRLKYLAFVQVAAVHVVLLFTNLYVYVKERSGSLKPCIEIIEGMVKSMVGLAFYKFFDVPFKLLQFFDSKVDEYVTKIDSLVPPVIKQPLSKAISAVQKALGVAGGVDTEIQPAGVTSTASGFIKQVSSEAISAAQKVPGVATEIQRAEAIIEEAQRLKYLVSLQVTFVHAVLYLSSLYVYIKERLGPLKPVIEIVERMVKSVYRLFFEEMVKSVVRLVLEKYFHVPVELLQFADGSKVGESVTKIDSLVPPVIKQVSSGALSAAQKATGVALGVATEVQPAGVVSTATGFIKQLSSEAILAAQKAPGVATEVQPAGVVSTASGFMKQVSSALKAPVVATEVQPVGVASTASGFIKQVASEAILAAQKAPGVATVVQPAGVMSTASGFIKQVSSEAISAVQKAPGVATEVQPAGVVSTASGFIKQVSSEAISVAQEVATEVGVSAWRKLNKLPLFPQLASVVVPTAACFTKKYNQTVVSSAEKGYKVASYLPLVPIEKIAKVFSEEKPSSQPLLLKRLFA